jgi:hypothetical protein
MVGGLVKDHGFAGYMKSGDCCGWRGASTILRARFSHIQVAVAGLGALLLDFPSYPLLLENSRRYHTLLIG